MKSFVAVFDNAPLGVSPWMRAAAKAGGLTLVSQEEVGRWLAEQPGFREALEDPRIKNFSQPHPSLTPYYREALATKVRQPRVALQGWGWLVFAERVDVCVLDFSGLEQHRQAGVARVGQKRMDDESKKRVAPERLLPLQALSEQEKTERVVRLLQRHAPGQTA
jgi:hypothetical protein